MSYRQLYLKASELELDKEGSLKKEPRRTRIPRSELGLGQVRGLTHNVRNKVTVKRLCLKCNSIWYDDTTIHFKVTQVCPYCGTCRHIKG